MRALAFRQDACVTPPPHDERHARDGRCRPTSWTRTAAFEPVSVNVSGHDSVSSGSSRFRVGIPTLLVGRSVGTLLIAIGFAGGRSHRSWAMVPFWLGWVMAL